jgi:hypothetical protein
MVSDTINKLLHFLILCKLSDTGFGNEELRRGGRSFMIFIQELEYVQVRAGTFFRWLYDIMTLFRMIEERMNNYEEILNS